MGIRQSSFSSISDPFVVSARRNASTRSKVVEQRGGTTQVVLDEIQT
jgi:hypothetical protein